MQQIWSRLSKVLRAEIRGMGSSSGKKSGLDEAERLIRDEREREEQLLREAIERLNDQKRAAPVMDDGAAWERDPEYMQACSRLGVPSDASMTVVSRAYRRLVAMHHPDNVVAGTHEQVLKATRQTREVIEAFQLIHRVRTAQ